RVLVIGQFTNNGCEPGMREKIPAANAAGAARYGDRYVDVQRFLLSPELTAVTGPPPTADDLAARRAGNKPTSLSADHGHLTMAGSLASAHHLRAHLHQVGWLRSSPG